MPERPTSSDPEQRERDTRESRRQSGLDPDPDDPERDRDEPEPERDQDEPEPERIRDDPDENP